jgi:4-hydroxymandelate oxidase
VVPTGFHSLLHPEAEPATAAACAGLGLLFTLSSRASCPLDRAAVPNAPWWFQSYVMRDRGLTAALVTRATELGAAALVLTVDAAVLPTRRRSRDEGLVDRSTMTVNAPGVEDLALLEPSPAVTPDDVRWLGDLAGLPVVVKGLV